MTPLNQEHWPLFDRACAGELSPNDDAQLAELLRTSPSARQQYLAYAALHADLHSAVRLSRIREKLLVEIADRSTPAEKKAAARRWSRLVAPFALAASVAIALVVANNRGKRTSGEEFTPWPGSVAVVSRIEAVKWSTDAPVRKVDQILQAGEALRFDSGVVEVEFHQGAVVVLEGPADFVCEDPNHGTLNAGKLAAVAPPWALGFRVATPKFDVVDHGTEFSVSVDHSGADPLVNLVVTEGEVEVVESEHFEPGHRLRAGEGVRSTGELANAEDDLEARKLTAKLPEQRNLNPSVVVGDRWHDWTAGFDGAPQRDGAWRHFTNSAAPFGEPAGYTELVWNEEEDCYLPPLDQRQADREGYVKVHRSGGHPGKGREQSVDGLDHYSITGFIVPEDGVYRLEAGWLERKEANRWDLDDVLDVAVHVNDQPVVLRETCSHTQFMRFRGSLGDLKAGDVIYVGVGPNGVDHSDRFRWSFSVVRELETEESTTSVGGAAHSKAIF